MLTRPARLPEAALADAVGAGWRIVPESVVYLPVGFGSHHWRVTDRTGGSWFLTLDDLAERSGALPRLRAALTTARAIADGGAGFVVAPIRTADGDVLRIFGGRYAAALYPYVSGRTREWGTELTDADRAAVLALVVTLHAISLADALPDDYGLPAGAALIQALDSTATRWDLAGPYGEQARTLFARYAAGLETLLARRADLAAQARDRPERMVLTHGEPHPGNLIQVEDEWLLVDWDTVLRAPPERDLWLLDPGDASVTGAYRDATGREILPSMLELYRLTWALSDIASAASRFRGEHGDSAEDRADWTVLRDTLSGLMDR